MKEEYKYKKLRKLGQELGIPMFEAFLGIEVSKGGNVIEKHYQRSHSWTRNAYNLLFTQLAGQDADDSTFGAGLLSGKSTAGSVIYGARPGEIGGGATSVDGTARGYRAPSGEDSWGIIIGTGTTAESFEDYALVTPVAEGTSAGQISHIASSAHSITYTAGTKVLKNDFVRYFNNNSGGSIVVAEIALAFYGSFFSGTYFIASRDLLGSTVTVPDTGQLKVTYTIELTYPS